MECRDVRELADSFLSEQLLVETTHDILRHLAQCRSCRGEIDARHRLRTALRSAFERSSDLRPSREFLASIGARVRERGSRSRLRRTWRPIMAIAASLLLASSIVFGGREWLGTSLVRTALGDHQNCALRYALRERPISLDEAAQRFEPAYRSLVAVAPSPERLSHGELTVLERHSCVYDRRRFAHLVLQYRGSLVSVLVTPDRLARVPPELRSVDGTRVSSFHVGRFAAFVVSSASDDEMHEIASAFAGPLKHALAGG